MDERFEGWTADTVRVVSRDGLPVELASPARTLPIALEWVDEPGGRRPRVLSDLRLTPFEKQAVEDWIVSVTEKPVMLPPDYSVKTRRLDW